MRTLGLLHGHHYETFFIRIEYYFGVKGICAERLPSEGREKGLQIFLEDQAAALVAHLDQHIDHPKHPVDPGGAHRIRRNKPYPDLGAIVVKVRSRKSDANIKGGEGTAVLQRMLTDTAIRTGRCRFA